MWVWWGTVQSVRGETGVGGGVSGGLVSSRGTTGPPRTSLSASPVVCLIALSPNLLICKIWLLKPIS